MHRITHPTFPNWFPPPHHLPPLSPFHHQLLLLLLLLLLLVLLLRSPCRLQSLFVLLKFFLGVPRILRLQRVGLRSPCFIVIHGKNQYGYILLLYFLEYRKLLSSCSQTMILSKEEKAMILNGSASVPNFELWSVNWSWAGSRAFLKVILPLWLVGSSWCFAEKEPRGPE